MFSSRYSGQGARGFVAYPSYGPHRGEGGGMECGGKHGESGGGREGGDPPEGEQGADGERVRGGDAKRDEGGQEEEEAISDSVWCQSILSALEAEMQEASILISPLYCDFYIVNILGC